MNVKLLLDENLSPKVAEVLAKNDGLDVVHVRDRGLLQATDHVVLERAHDEADLVNRVTPRLARRDECLRAPATAEHVTDDFQTSERPSSL